VLGDEEDIFKMLRMLSGRTHRVITGVCVINTRDKKFLLESDTSYIKFRDIDDIEIKKYIESGEPFDKAGSYAIQGLGTVFIEKMEGSYTGVVGLPLFIVDKMLKQFGINTLGGNKS
jgi:septum formation protein